MKWLDRITGRHTQGEPLSLPNPDAVINEAVAAMTDYPELIPAFLPVRTSGDITEAIANIRKEELMSDQQHPILNAADQLEKHRNINEQMIASLQDRLELIDRDIASLTAQREETLIILSGYKAANSEFNRTKPPETTPMPAPPDQAES